MVDITMCTGLGCPLKKSCKRFLATPSAQLQSWFQAVPYDTVLKQCNEPGLGVDKVE